MKKRLLSLFLVFALLVTAFPVGVFAAGEKQDEITNELNVKTVKMDGKSYVEIPIGKINDGVHFRAIDPNIPTKDGAGQKINASAAIVWQMHDWNFPAEGFKAQLKIGIEGDPRNNETIAEVQVKGTVPIPEKVGENDFQFITTDKYQKGDENKRLKLVFDNSFRANARIAAGYDNDAVPNGRCYYIVVTQITMPAYTAEWYDNGDKTTRPTIKGILYSAGKKEAKVDVKKENLKYGSIAPKHLRYVDENDINGNNIGMVDFVPTGSITEAQLKMSVGQKPIATGKFVSYVTKEIDPSDFSATETEHKLDNTSGKIESHAITSMGGNPGKKSPAYFYQLIGDNNHLWRFQMREVLAVKLNSGAGKVGEAANKELHVSGKDSQEIGHSEKIYNNDVELTDYIRKLYPKKAGETDEQLKKRVSEATQSQRVIDFNTDETVTPPKVKVDGTEVDALFKGWATKPQTINEKGELSAIEGKLVDEKGNLTPAGKTFKFTEKETTLYRVYEPKGVGKVNFAYVDAAGSPIDAKYKFISNQDGKDVDDKGAKLTLETKYPLDKTSAEGDVIEAALASTAKAPSFIGYKVTGVEIKEGNAAAPAGATYTEDGKYTITYKYEKLPDIIPEKKNGQDNPDVTPDVKENYAKLTYQVAAADTEKAKLQLDNADATSPLVYYVNPLEGKKIKDVADVKALTKDKNLYKVDANDMWTFKPESINSTDQEIMQVRDDQDNVVKTEITLTAKVADTDAQKYGDKLEAQDIVKWVDEDVDWKEGVKPIQGVTFKNVEDLGNRNTTNAGVFPGKLKVTFNDDSTKEIDNQKLIVRAKKGDKVTPDDNDPGTYPKDALEVKFVAGTGIKALDPANKVMVLQKDEALEAKDYPTVTVKANHETKAKNVDYYDVQPGKLTAKETTITASTTEKGKKDVTFSFEFYNSKKSTEQIPASVLKGRFEPTVPEKQTGKYVGSAIDLPTQENKVVSTGDLQGTWKFDGWYRNGNKVTDAKVSANDAENKLVGKWILTETAEAKVTREFAIDPAIVGDGKDVPTGHALPNDVKKQKPNDTTNYIGSEQTPGKDNFNPVPEKIGDKEGTWTFKAWNKAKLTVDANEANNVFTGTWTWTEKGKINIKYVFKGVGTDRALPQEILDQKPTDTSGYQAPAADPTLPAVASHDVIVNGDKVGTWTRGDKWKKDTDTNGNITYTLTWTFKEIKSDDPIINPVKPGDKKIEGKGKPGSQVKVTIPRVEKPIEVDVNEKGDWTVEVPKDKKLKDGDVIKAKQKTPGLPESNEVTRKVEGDTPSEPKNYDGYINLEPVGEQEAKHATDIHVIYLYGYQDKTVHPQGDMTRAEAAAMVARLKNLDMSDTSKPDFKDVESRWYNSAINAVVKAGLMKGYPDGTFAPNGKITRAEFAQLIKGIDNPNMAELPFTDVAGHWGLDAISQAYANKRIMGYPDNTFKPNNDITRAEAVTILNSLFDRGINEAGLANVRKDIVEFKDLDRSHWAYYQIIEASNTHEFYRAKDGEVPEVWVRVLKTWNDFLK